MPASTALNRYKTYYLFKKLLVYLSVAVLLADTVYKTYYGITLQTRENCLLYKNVPRPVFMIYENIIELFIVVVLGVFAAELLGKYFIKIKKYTPKNIFSAFILASVIPACSCSVIPMIKGMEGKMKMSVILTFVFTAPLLNPYIIALSFGVLGLKYTLLRIAASFLLASSAGLFVERFLAHNKLSAAEYKYCTEKFSCTLTGFDIYESTFRVIKKIFPYILLSGFAAIVYEYFINRQLISTFNFGNGIAGLIIAVAAGVPIYLCNGADVLFLKPLVAVSHLPLGTAVAFSLTSTAVCISSIVMLSGFLGKRTTTAAVIFIIALTLVIGSVINMVSG